MMGPHRITGGIVATEQIGDYEIDYSGIRLEDVDGWAAWVLDMELLAMV